MKTINFKFLWLLLASGGFLLNSCTKEIEYISLETSDLKVSVQKTGNISLSPNETLGKHIFFDKISSPKWMECSTCHAPSFGYTGPIAGININSAGVYRGADP